MRNSFKAGKRMRVAAIVGLLLGSACLPRTLLAADKPPAETSTITFIFENDLFGNTDDEYTSGLQLGWLSPDLKHYEEEQRLPRWLLPLVHVLPFINVPDSQHNVGFAIGQQIFTPKDTQSRALVKDDRPYAGWLYGGLSFISKNESVLDTVEIQLGVVGPWALAEEAQSLVHDIRGLVRPQGWDNQLNNEPGLALIYEHKRRLLRSTNASGFGYDVITHAGGALGNVFTYLNAGGEVRLGWNLPGDYGTSIIRPGGDTNAPTSVNDPRVNSHESIGFYLFGGVSGRLVLRDIFLDGNSFSRSHSVDKEALVGDAVVGVSLTLRSWKLSYAQALRSREFEQQRGIHNFGSISLSYTF